MFRIRRIYDDVLPINKEALIQIKAILKSQFSSLSDEELDGLGEKLRNPFKQKFRLIPYIAENGKNQVLGCAILMHEPIINFCYLDFLASEKRITSRGIGAALYEFVREESKGMKANALFYECLPDDPADCPNPEMLKQNIARLKFYERFGARPIINTDYQRKIKPEDQCMPFLVYDELRPGALLPLRLAKEAVRAILERKYGKICTPEYIKKVLESFRDDPVRIREPRYTRKNHVQSGEVKPKYYTREQIYLVVNALHSIHHVRERGYVESPIRVKNILAEILPMGLFHQKEPSEFAERFIKSVHDAGFVDYLRRACSLLPEGKSLYPYVFPIRNAIRPPKELTVRAGYYCIDTFTPLNRNAYLAAKRAVDCALTAARSLTEGWRLAYALVRPPGHHAERKVFGGFCYFNNAAIAAQYLSEYGRIAILDLDYHHGNGQQDIFYERSDVFTVSLHGHPNIAYPYFTGFEDEIGAGNGEGFNLNMPLQEKLDGKLYQRALHRALRRIADFRPVALIVCLGLDTAKGDPTGTWDMVAKDFETNGRMIAELKLPTLVVQEGGYRTRTLGANARNFFQGLVEVVR